MTTFKVESMIDECIRQSENIKKLRLNGEKDILIKEEFFFQMSVRDLCSVISSMIGNPIWNTLSIGNQETAKKIWNEYSTRNLQKRVHSSFYK